MAGRGQKDAIRSPMSIYEVHMGSWRKKEARAVVVEAQDAPDPLPLPRWSARA